MPEQPSKQDEKQARLAKALKNNIRRRKAATKPVPTEKEKAPNVDSK